MISYASVAAQLHLADVAERLIALLGPYHEQVPCQGVTSREPIAIYVGGLAGVLGRFDEAEHYFGEAAELSIRGGMRYAEAQNNLWWARMLLEHDARGDAERASGLLVRAREAAAARGYGLVEARAAALQAR
jgi:hypothetical protein